MEKTHTQHILILITNPFAMLNVVHSGLMRELGRTYRVSVMSNLLSEADVAHLNAHFQLHMRLLKCPIPRISRYLKWLRAFQAALFAHFFRLETFRIKLAERHRILAWLFRMTGNSPALRACSGWLFIWLRHRLINRTSRSRARLPGAHCFAAVISTSPLDLRENRIVNALKTRGTRCIAMIISWDNLTSKGIINAAPDLVLVWNKLMADEYEQLYSLFGNVGALRVTGVPRFGIYAKPPDPLKVAVFRGKLGIVPRACVILFSTGAVKHHVCQDYVIEDLLEYARTRPEVVIMVRCHPGDEPGKYERFSGYKNLRFLPSFRQCKEDIPPRDFLETLQIQLAASQVCIQIASTMLLDAAACDKPVISIAYDAHPQVPYRASVRRFYDYAHYQPLRLLLKENIVHDRTALFAKLDALAENGWQAPKWQSVLKTVMNLSTPEPARTTAQCIQEWLDA